MISRRRTTTQLLSLRAHEAGSQAVELALMLPLLLAAFCGVIEGGRVLFTLAALNFAAEEATRFATVNPNAAIQDIQNIAQNNLIMIEPNGIVGFNVALEPQRVDQTNLVTVEIAFTFQPILPIGLAPFTMTGHSRGFLVDR